MGEHLDVICIKLEPSKVIVSAGKPDTTMEQIFIMNLQTVKFKVKYF